jgi:hypothetical protein
MCAGFLEKTQVVPFPVGKRKAENLAVRFVEYGPCFQQEA